MADRKDSGGVRASSRLPVIKEDSPRGRTGIGRGGPPPPGDGANSRASGIGRGIPVRSNVNTEGGKTPGTGGAGTTPTARPSRLGVGVTGAKEGGRKGSGLPRLTTANTTMTTSIPSRSKPSGLRPPTVTTNPGGISNSEGQPNNKRSPGGVGNVRPDPKSPNSSSGSGRGGATTDSGVNPENKSSAGRLVATGGGHDGKALARPSALPLVDGSRGNSSSSGAAGQALTKPQEVGGGNGGNGSNTAGPKAPAGPKARQRMTPGQQQQPQQQPPGSNLPSRPASRIPNPGGAGAGGAGGLSSSGVPTRRRSRLGSSGSTSGGESRRRAAPSNKNTSSSSKPTSPDSTDSEKKTTTSPKSPNSPLTAIPPRPPRLIPRRIPTPRPPPRTTSKQNVSPTRKRFSSTYSLSSSQTSSSPVNSYVLRRPSNGGGSTGGRTVMSSEDDEGSQCTSPDAGLSSSASVCGSELSDTSTAPYSDVSIPSPVQLREHILLDWDTDSYASTSVGASPDVLLEGNQSEVDESEHYESDWRPYESDWKTDSFISQHADSGWYTDSCFSPNSPKDYALPELREYESESSGIGEGCGNGEGGRHNLFLRLNSNSSVESKRSSRVSLDSFMLPPSPEDENGVLRIDSEHLAMVSIHMPF